MIVAIGRFDLHLTEAQTLKEKRHIIKCLLDRIKAKFNASIAEVDHNDLWQRSLIGVAVVANDRILLTKIGQRIEEILQDHDQVRIMDLCWEYI